jgi:type IV pilus assembly protein PilM
MWMAEASMWRKRFGKLMTLSLSDLNPLRGEEAYLSVDIGSSSIKLLEVRGGGHGLRVTAFGSLPTPAGAVQSNMVYEPESVAELIRALVESKKIRARKSVTAVPGPAVIIKRMTIAAQSPAEVENTVLFEAGNFIPEDLENVNLDYQITDYLDDGKRMEVLLVAAKRDIVASYTDTLRAAALVPAVVDVDYFALENMFEINYDLNPEQVIALVNIGARYSSINILKGGRSTFTGDVPVGGRDITEAVMRELGVTAEEAETIKGGGTLPKVPPEQAEAVLTSATDGLIEEINHALGFFWTAATDEAINNVYLSGGSVRMGALAESLSRRLEVPVEVANPFARVTVERQADTPGLRQNAAALAVAVGLASRRPNDK